MFAARPVAIDNDTIRRSGPSAEVNADTIHRSIAQSLRRLQKGEERVSGTIEKIECSPGNATFTVAAANRMFKLAQSIDARPEIGWFTVASSQLPLSCGSGPINSPTLITFTPAEKQDGIDGIIRAIEFVPEGFVP
jgi:hypothetical protein